VDLRWTAKGILFPCSVICGYPVARHGCPLVALLPICVVCCILASTVSSKVNLQRSDGLVWNRNGQLSRSLVVELSGTIRTFSQIWPL
jgi:hypothetical protein